jgi:hypothetical protein
MKTIEKVFSQLSQLYEFNRKLKTYKLKKENKKGHRDREEPHSSPLPHHAAYGSVRRGSADQASSAPGERKPK